MNKTVFIGLILLLFTISLSANSNTIDSLLGKLDKNPKEDSRLVILNQLAIAYKFIDASKTIEYAEKAYDLAKILENFEEKHKALVTIGDGFFYFDEFEQAKDYFKEALLIATKIEAKYNISYTYAQLGNVCKELGEYKKSFEYYKSALAINTDLNNKVRISSTLNNLGDLFRNWGDFDEAVKYYDQSEKVAQDVGNKELLAKSCKGLGLVNIEGGNHKSGIEYFNKAITIYNQTEIRFGKGEVLENLANAYVQLNNYNKALEYFRESLSLYHELGRGKNIGNVLYNMAIAYYSIGQNTKAEKYLNHALVFQLKGGFKKQIACSYLKLAELKLDENKYIETKKYLDSCKHFATNNTWSGIHKELFKQYAILYEQTGKPKLALNQYVKYANIKDSLLNTKKENEISKWQVRQEFDKIKIENELNKAKLDLQKRTLIYFIVFGVLIVLLIIFILYRLNISKKLNKLLKAKSKELEDQKDLYQHALTKLKDSESKLRNVFDNSVIGVGVTTKEGHFEFVNHAFAKMIGYDIDEVTSLTNRDITFPDDYSETDENVKRIFNGEIESFIQEKRVIRKDGEIFWGQFAISANKDDDGNIKNLIGIVKDITLAKQIEEKNKDSLAFLEILIDTIPSPVFYKDIEGKYIGFNQAFLEIVGKQREEVLGKTMFEIAPNDFTELYHAKDLIIIQTGEKQQYEAEVKHSDGTVHDVIFHKSAFKSSTGEIAGIVGIITDITKRKQLEQSNKEAKIKAEKATYLKSMFLANMSHEIRTPMNGIIGMIDILMQSGVREEQKEYLEIVNISSQNLLTIIDDILDFSKIESGQITLEHIDFNLKEQVDEISKLLQFKAQEKQIKLFVNYTTELPGFLNGDPYRLKQILLNLTNNAVKFTHKGSVEIEVQLKSRVQNDITILFKVIDTGIGLSKAQISNLFLPYGQANEATSRMYGGTGLGLLISKNLAELMNGQIGVESVENEGSTFWFTAVFKNALNLNENYIENQNKNQEIVITPSDKQLHVLVAEDDFMNQRFLTILLGKMGHSYDVADDGLKAIEKFKEGNYDCILMDIDMPELDGLGATREIREIERTNGITDGIKIIAVTAKVIQGDRERCIDAGMNSYISKPFKSHDLNNVMHEVGLL